eukprot:m.378756 g.378756  ORF g.378756 m.378756 type:complete len:211 (-) comp56205_c0_seq1:2644-3276(-)
MGLSAHNVLASLLVSVTAATSPNSLSNLAASESSPPSDPGESWYQTPWFAAVSVIIGVFAIVAMLFLCSARGRRKKNPPNPRAVADVREQPPSAETVQTDPGESATTKLETQSSPSQPRTGKARPSRVDLDAILLHIKSSIFLRVEMGAANIVRALLRARLCLLFVWKIYRLTLLAFFSTSLHYASSFCQARPNGASASSDWKSSQEECP